MAFPQEPSPFKPKLKRSPAYVPCMKGLILSSTSIEVGTVSRPNIVRRVFPLNARHLQFRQFGDAVTHIAFLFEVATADHDVMQDTGSVNSR
jgi:hypothetical protein